ncbi:MAG: hypothetical protein US75_C0043G0004, partial [Candidatus Woesebacteria bacterium GW2011_GWC1_38_13]
EYFSIANNNLSSGDALNVTYTDNSAGDQTNTSALKVDFNTADDALAETMYGIELNIDNNATIADNTVYGLYINSENAESDDTDLVADAMIYLNNADTDNPIPDGILFGNSGSGGYIDYIDTPSSVFKVDGSGNLTSVNLTSTGNTNIGNANTDTLIINAGSSGTGITLADDSFNSCTALETDASGNLVCGSDAEGTGVNYWQLGTQGLAPYNTTLDFYVGGTATAGATFAVEALTGNVQMDGDLTITGGNITNAVTFDTGLSVATSQTITIGGDSIDEFVGTGLTISSGDLQTTLGAAIDTSEITDDTITASDLNSTLTFADGDLIDFSSIIPNTATEGLKLTQGTDCSAQTAEGLICWDTDDTKLYIGNDGGVTEIGAGGGGALDTLTAATTDDTALLNADYTIEWNWALTSATSKGITLGESAASTGGSGDQHILRLDTVTGSTAGPLEIVSNSADGGDIEINLNSDGDFEIQDNGTAFVVFDSDGVSTFSDDVTFTLVEAEDFALNWSVSGTQSGQGEVLSVTNSSSSGNQYGLYLDNVASTGTTEALLVIDNSDTDTAVTAGIQFVNAGGGMTAGIDMANLIIANIGAAGTDFNTSGGLTLADGLIVTTGGASITGAITNVTTMSTSGDWTWTATTPTITINDNEIFTIADEATADTFTINTSGSLFSFSDGTNSFTFDVDSGPLYAGTARPTKKVTLSPEYPGAVLTGDGADNVGTITSDFCSNGNTNPPDINIDVCQTSGDLHNYYSWTTTTSGNDYDIWVSYQIPSDFDGFSASDTIKAYGWNTDNTVNAVTVSLYDDNDAICGSATDVATGTATWTQTALTGDETGCSAITAGDIVTFRIQLDADAGDYARVGEISFSYYAKF